MSTRGPDGLVQQTKHWAAKRPSHEIFPTRKHSFAKLKKNPTPQKAKQRGKFTKIVNDMNTITSMLKKYREQNSRLDG